ncbi:hypothetical protein KUA24_100 [Vibrio phage HNL01]|nr:hypothetical protein KUA24_100 [Vibrio phage HNL01]
MGQDNYWEDVLFEWTQEDTDCVMGHAKRREFLGELMNTEKLECPACKTRQVQLIGYIDITPAKWKCRTQGCRTVFEWEGYSK